MSVRKIVFDIETTGSFIGRGDLSQLELTIVCIWDSATNEYSSYLKEELPKLWPILERSDMLIGYNSDHFDIPILNKYYPGDLTRIKSLDLMKEVQEVLGRRLRLDTLAQATLGKKKSGKGDMAMEWWAKGEIEKLRKYCLKDVEITKDLYEYALKNGSLKYRDIVDGMREIKLDTSKWETAQGAAMTHTLPF